MPTTHTVVQGDTLTRIAKQYNYGSAKALYGHPDNADFRALRPNMNIIYPGDVITIPDIAPKRLVAKTGMQHIFCVKREKEHFRMKVETNTGKVLSNTRIVAHVGSKTIDTLTDSNGMLDIELPEGNECDATLDVYLTPQSQEPEYSFEAKLTHLDPVEELSGVQARCNALGHNCGTVDGVMGAKTRAGIKSFQARYKLQVDGIPGPKTQAKLKEIYGS